MTEAINHPSHYDGDTPYEAIKVIEADYAKAKKGLHKMMFDLNVTV